MIRSRTQGAMEQDVVFHYLTTETRYTVQYLLSPARYWGIFGIWRLSCGFPGQRPF